MADNYASPNRIVSSKPKDEKDTWQSLAAQLRTDGLTDLKLAGDKFKDNETVGNQVVGAFLDDAKARIKTGNAVLYNQALYNTLEEIDKGRREDIKTDTADLLAIEANLAGDLAGQQIKGSLGLQRITNAGTKSVADIQKKASDRQAQAQEFTALRGKEGIVRQSQATEFAASRQKEASDYRVLGELAGVKEQSAAVKYGADKTVDVAKEQSSAVKYGADKTVDVAKEQSNAARYGADKTVDVAKEQSAAVKYGADKTVDVEQERSAGALALQREQNLATKYGIDSQERQIGMKGAEDRKTLAATTAQQMRLRADARGAVARSGARFYG